VILDRREKPEDVHAELSRLARNEPFALVLIDTLAAFFDGDNINDAVQGGEFIRRLRPLTRIAGLPTVIVAARPVKNASADALVPYGSGAILNEIDGNLTLWKKPETGIVSLHWQGKLRGLEFQPVPFRFEITGSPDILDAKGRQVHLPTLRPSSEQASEDRDGAEVDTGRALLRAMIANPNATQRDLAIAVSCSGSSINRNLKALRADKLVEQILDNPARPKGNLITDPSVGGFRRTPRQKKEIENAHHRRHREASIYLDRARPGTGARSACRPAGIDPLRTFALQRIVLSLVFPGVRNG